MVKFMFKDNLYMNPYIKEYSRKKNNMLLVEIVVSERIN